MEKFTFSLPGFDVDPFLFVIFLLLPLFVAFLCLFYSFRFLKIIRRIEDTPTSKIRSAAQGYVRLKGNLSTLSQDSVKGKLSQKPCVWYRYSIAELRRYQTEQGTTERFETIASGMSDIPFILKDPTGECIVFPRSADIITNSTLQWYGQTPHPLPPQKPSIWAIIFGPRGQFCYREERLEPDSYVAITGMFYTIHSDHDIISKNPFLLEYFQHKPSYSVHILNNEGLEKKQSLFISAHPENKVLRQYRVKAFIFFLGFLFFVFITLSSTYPIVMKTLEQMPSLPLRREG